MILVEIVLHQYTYEKVVFEQTMVLQRFLGGEQTEARFPAAETVAGSYPPALPPWVALV